MFTRSPLTTLPAMILDRYYTRNVYPAMFRCKRSTQSNATVKGHDDTFFYYQHVKLQEKGKNFYET